MVTFSAPTKGGASSMAADLRVGFYISTCPQAESIINELVHIRFEIDLSISGALLTEYLANQIITSIVAFFFVFLFAFIDLRVSFNNSTCPHLSV
ncbi:hypothetical protein DVH24_038092 [Malus domestica]|uniref:Uncharacterized protein n=1 Tax=Malus domestica TaxID=3750 RepID=A0A498K8R5_MALDO|nr:hypothetical protein DVH24_038092 [Malus domestica]